MEDDATLAGTGGGDDDAGGNASADPVAALKEELQRMKDLAARAQADLQNAKGRMEKEAQAIRSYAVEGLLIELLPTIDNFQRAFAHLPEELQENEWVKGVAAVEQELMRQLSGVGLKKMEALGEEVNPDKHEALQTGPGEEGVVVEVIEDGYELGDRVLRPAKVVAGSG